MVEPTFQIYKSLELPWNTGARLNESQQSGCCFYFIQTCQDMDLCFWKKWSFETSQLLLSEYILSAYLQLFGKTSELLFFTFLINCFLRYPDNCPPRKINLRLGLGFGSRSGLILGLGGNQTIAPDENCPSVRVRVWLRVSFGVGGQFSSEAIALEPFFNSSKKAFPITRKFFPWKYLFFPTFHLQTNKDIVYVDRLHW